MSNEGLRKQKAEKLKQNEGEQLVLGLGPVQTSFWRLSRLVPLEGVRRQFNKYKWKQGDPVEGSSVANSAPTSSLHDVVAAPQSLEIQEGSDGISLEPLAEKERGSQDEAKDRKPSGNINATSSVNTKAWRRVPNLPSYVPFGQVVNMNWYLCSVLCYLVLNCKSFFFLNWHDFHYLFDGPFYFIF